MGTIKAHIQDHDDVGIGVETFTRIGIFVAAVDLCALGEGLIKHAIRAGIGGSVGARRFPNYSICFLLCVLLNVAMLMQFVHVVTDVCFTTRFGDRCTAQSTRDLLHPCSGR